MRIASYYSHRIYCEENYPILIDLLNGFLTSKKYYIETADETYRYYTRTDLTVSDSSTSVIAAPERFYLKDYNGVLFRVVNSGRKCSERKQKFHMLPIGIRQRFSYYPNFIEIESLFKLYQLQVDIGNELLTWLHNKNRKAYIRNFEGEFLDIIETAYISEADKAEEIDNLFKKFLTTQQLEECNFDTYPKNLSFLLPKMHPDTIIVLKTAELINTAFPNLPDCSAIAIEYCKAIEIELADKVLKPLRNYWLSTLPVGFPNPPVPNDLKRLRKYLFTSKSPKQIELGTLAVTIDCALNNLSNPVANSLIDKLNNLPFLNYSPSKLKDDVIYLTQNYRNPAAHKSILSKQQLQQCRDFVVGTENRPGLLFRIIEAA